MSTIRRLAAVHRLPPRPSRLGRARTPPRAGDVERARLEGVVAEGNNARARLEKMCRAFKDEIDTLNEALVVAGADGRGVSREER